jgi:hypothetical protein
MFPFELNVVLCKWQTYRRWRTRSAVVILLWNILKVQSMLLQNHSEVVWA